jgi:DNA-binding XRE family transcriptional regulator
MQSALESIPNVSATGSAFSAKWNNAFLTAVFLVGTGGVAIPRTINYVPSGMLHVRVSGGYDSTIDSDRMLDAQEKLAGIRRYLSMSVTDLAKVLHVGRPTIYSWLRDEATLRAEHAQRLEVVYGLARNWRMISNRPVGSLLNQPLASGITPLSLLSAKTLDELEIQSAFAQIQDTLSRTVPRRGVAEVAKQRGFKLATIREPNNWSSNEDFDV